LFPDSSGGARVRAVPAAPGSFASRKALPTPWRALRDEELSTLIGIEGCVFVHNSGFIGGNKTQEGALEMARAAIRFEDEK
jgi:urease accessory protein|tara:strand:- start:27 stop:269 length:243 start_codon:yes stop_codon:yes gene_type:complete